MSLIRDYWTAMNGNDWQAVADHFLSEDFIGLWPQTGEVIRGRADFVRVNAAFPGQKGWLFEVMAIAGDSSLVASDVRVMNHGIDAQARALTFHDIADGRITRQVEFWPDPYPVPDWRPGLLTVDSDLARF